MLDVTTKLQSGILYGNLKVYGSFNKCLEIEGVVVKGDQSKNIIGQRCITTFPFHSLITRSSQLRNADKIVRIIVISTNFMIHVCRKLKSDKRSQWCCN